MAHHTIATGTTDLLAEVSDDGIGVATFNRPERRNALTDAMLRAFADVLAEFESDPAVRCVVVTGAGGAFCAGGDVKGFAAGAARGEPTGPGIDQRIHAQRLSQRATAGALWRMPKPTVAALGGPAAGAGLSIALACDLRVAVDTAVLTTAFARVGFSGDYGGSWFLTQLVGPARAKQLYYRSERLTAAQAESLGLVNWIFAANEFEAGWRAIASDLAAGPSIAHRYMKENINRAAHGADMLDCMDIEATHHVHCGQTEDHIEAARAFVNKTEPVFHGR